MQVYFKDYITQLTQKVTTYITSRFQKPIDRLMKRLNDNTYTILIINILQTSTWAM